MYELPRDQTTVSESSTSLRFPVADWQRVLYGPFVVFMPLFIFSVVNVLKPEWQSGRLQDYVALFLQPSASVGFIILLVYSIICYCLLLINIDRFSRNFLIRFGVYTGVVLALQYAILTILYLFENQTSLIIVTLSIWLFPLYFPKIFQWSLRKWDGKQVRVWMLLLIGIGFVVTVVVYQGGAIFIPLAALCMAAPFWSFLMAMQVAMWLFKNYEINFTLSRGLGIIVWLGGYAVAWRFDILKMYELYSQLPTSPPDCYIATAAAHGHPQFVHSWNVKHVDGNFMRVNRQLQLLKCAELALLAIHPRLHKLLRGIYNVIGKWLALRIQDPLVADMAYLFLKPWEWLAESILKTIVPEIETISAKVYISVSKK